MTYFLIYLCIINLVAFSLMGIDKRRARRHAWRIPERTLFLSALLGGGAGAILGMQLFRHKTKPTAFVVGMPCIFLMETAALLWFFCFR